MSIYLPLGIGLFHASNTRFLHVAQRQKQFIDKADIPNAPSSHSSKFGDILGRLRELDHSAKAVVLVSAGMFFQVRPTYPPILIRRRCFKFGTPRANNVPAAIHGNFHVPHLPQMA